MYQNELTLNNGVKIPQLGLGTWFIDDDKAADAVKAAVKLMAMSAVSGKVSVPAVYPERNFLLYQKLQQSTRPTNLLQRVLMRH